MKKLGVLTIAIYANPEYFPPTLNAIELLAEKYEHIYIVHRNIKGFDWIYPANVTLITKGSALSVPDTQVISMRRKIAEFIGFSSLLAKTIRKYKSRDIIFYDYLPLLSYRLVKSMLPPQNLLWYHNHDVAEKQYVRKYSLSYWAWKSEKWIFPRLALFTLPAIERKEFFPMEKLNGQFFFVPNFPSVKVYSPFQNQQKTGDAINILYQGSIGPDHGLEEIISVLNSKIAGKEICLVLKGFISREYLEKLNALAQQYGVQDKLIYKGAGGYRSVIGNAAGCHIGIGIHKKQDLMNKTLGTASNKIYEYAALGLPALLYDNIHFRSHLGKFNWAFFTDCSQSSLINCLEEIVHNYETLSLQAKKDFLTDLNFERFFIPVRDSLA